MGSEMCIRDRSICSVDGEAYFIAFVFAAFRTMFLSPWYEKSRSNMASGFACEDFFRS